MDRSNIIHIDMDAFFAAVEVLDRPELAGKPVIVGGGPQRGVVCSATYEARAFGVRSAMPTARAHKLCPHAVFLPVRRGRYKEISERVFDVFLRYTPLVQPVSIDEAFLDVSGCDRLFGDSRTVAKKIRADVLAETGCTASAGVAPTKLVAKIASDLDKPDGLVYVAPDRVPDFLAPLSISRLWGVGPAMRARLEKMGIRTIGDLRAYPRDVLSAKFGKYGGALYDFSRGIDGRAVHTEQETKSIGNEETFSTDLWDKADAMRHLLYFADKVSSRLRKHGFEGRTVCLKVKYADFTQKTRSLTLDEPTSDPGTIYGAVGKLVSKTEIGRRPVRLLGVSVSNLAEAGAGRQLSLFEQGEHREKRDRLNRAVDDIREKYGNSAIWPGTLGSD
ncbi:MAG: DNA polymerase IV [Desulfatibacillaceae bacterium]